MWERGFIRELFFMGIETESSKEATYPNLRILEMPTKPSKISVDLMRKLSRMTNDQSIERSIFAIN